MEKQQLFFKWLAVAAIVEWLLGRTVTRAAIHIPKSPEVIVAYTAVNQIAQVMATFVALLSFMLLVWIGWQARRTVWLPLTLVSLAGLSLLFLVIVPPVWLALAYQLLAASALVLMSITRGRASPGRSLGTPWLLPALALLIGVLYQLLPTVYVLGKWPGPPPFMGTLFNLGELLVIASVVVWWWGYGRGGSWHLWFLAAIPALLFTLSFQRDPAMTGILTIWSTGLTLFLPWPVYAVALWLAGVTVLAAWQRQPLVAYALLLFTAAGYAPQLSSQLFCGLIALWLLTRPLPIAAKQTARRQPEGGRVVTAAVPVTDNP